MSIKGVLELLCLVRFTMMGFPYDDSLLLYGAFCRYLKRVGPQLKSRVGRAAVESFIDKSLFMNVNE